MTLAEIRAALADLKRRRAALRDAQRALIGTARAESRDLTDAERGQFDTRLADIERLNADEERLAALEADELRRLGSNPDVPPTPEDPNDYFGGRRGGGAPGPNRGAALGASFRQMFPERASQGTGGFRSLEEFLIPLSRGMWDSRYEQFRTMGSGDGNGTGLNIPTEFSAQLFDMSLEGEIIRPRATIYPMRSDTRTIAGFTVGGDGEPFGISGGWTAPGATIGQAEPKTRAITLTANKLAVLTAIHNETIADGVANQGPSVDEQLSAAQSRGIGWLLDRSFIRGNGAGQPLGILNAPCTITVEKEAGQEAGTIFYENLVAMFARLHPAHVSRSVWIANPTTIPQLLTLGHMVGVGGAPVPVLRDDGNGGFTILTRPCVFSEKVPALGERGDLMLCDVSQYAVGLRAELSLEKSIHVGFSNDTSHYRAILRADGQPTWDAPYVPDEGDSLSPFVVLEARA